MGRLPVRNLGRKRRTARKAALERQGRREREEAIKTTEEEIGLLCLFVPSLDTFPGTNRDKAFPLIQSPDQALFVLTPTGSGHPSPCVFPSSFELVTPPATRATYLRIFGDF